MMITTNGLGKRFGQVEVLKSIDFQVAAREIVVLLGPSGSGKSTLLRCLNGLEELSSGKFEVNGIEVDATAPVRVRQAAIREIRKQTGMLFQQFNLYPHKTAIGNVIEGLLTVKNAARQGYVHRTTVVGAGGVIGQAGCTSFTSVRWTTATSSHCACAGDGPGDYAVRRADIGA